MPFKRASIGHFHVSGKILLNYPQNVSGLRVVMNMDVVILNAKQTYFAKVGDGYVHEFISINTTLMLLNRFQKGVLI